MSAKALSHEEFQVAPLKSGRLKVIRQDRIALPDGALKCHINSIEFTVDNISSTGIQCSSLVPMVETSMHVGSQIEIKMSNGHADYEPIEMRIVRADQGPSVTVALESVNCEINVERIKTDLRAIYAVKNSFEQFGLWGKINPNVIAEVQKIKKFLEILKTEIEKVEDEQPLDSLDEQFSHKDAICEVVARKIKPLANTFFDKIYKALNQENESERENSYRYIRDELGPLVFGAPSANRAYTKPLGYAGDFMMMVHLYKDENVGACLFDQIMHRYFIEEPGAVAVRNRGFYLRDRLKAAISKNIGSEITIASIASGPAMEIQLLIRSSEKSSLSNVEVHLFDQDEVSLKFAQREINRLESEHRTGIKVKYNNYAMKNILARGLNKKDYDLVYSAGLFDYFSDPLAREAAKKFIDSTKIGGQVIIGNFSDMNPTQPMMEVLLDWNLIYRSENDMHRLFDGIGREHFVESENLRVNLFSVIVK